MTSPFLKGSVLARRLASAPRPVLIAATLVLVLGVVACGNGDAPKLAQPDRTGQELTNTYITLLAKKDTQGLQDFISDGFIIQRADGSAALKADYLRNLPTIGEFTIRDVTARQVGDSLVVRWELTVNEIIDGRPFQTAPAPRLSTFVWEKGKWRLLSHANFNSPASSPR